jgi:hypothetical protein
MRREHRESAPWRGRPAIDLLRDNPRTRRLLPAAAAALIAVGVGQLADLITFTSMVRAHGLDAEANPVARAALEMGMPTVIALKALLILLVLALFVADSPRHPRMAAMIVTIATMAGLLGAASNIATL